MKDLVVGQVLSMKIRYNNAGVTATTKHPYLIVGIDTALNVVEIAQIDSLKGKEFKAAKKSNKTIFCDNPKETVIDKDSYVQLDNTIRVEYFETLSDYRRQSDTLSAGKLSSILRAYKTYHDNNQIDELKNVYMDEHEIASLNP